MRWQDAGDDGNCTHRARSGCEYARIQRGYVEQHSLRGFGGQPSADDAKQRASRKQTQTQRQELVADLAGLCAEGHAHSDFAATLFDGVTQHAIGADSREKQSYRRKKACEQGW